MFRRRRRNDPDVLLHEIGADITNGAFDLATRKALDALARPDLTDLMRASFLRGYANSLLCANDPATFDAAADALTEAERLVPAGLNFIANRAFLALRRNDRTEAARLARIALDKGPSGAHSLANVVLADALIAQHGRDGRTGPELITQLKTVIADPGVGPTTAYARFLATMYSYAGDHVGAVALMRTLVPRTDELDYNLAYLLARSGDPAGLPEIDRLLAALPPDYPWPAARAHTTALRHLVAGDGAAALASVEEALQALDLGIANQAEGLLTRARALDLLGRGADAKADRARAADLAPDHRLLQPGSEPG